MAKADMNKVPDSGVIHVKPKKNAKVVGNATYAAKKVKGISGAEYDLPRRMFVIPGEGIILTLSNPEHRKTYDILLGPNPGIRGYFNKTAKMRYRFDIVDIGKEADDYLKNDELKTDYKGQVMKMKATELQALGLFFKLGRDEKTIKAGLYKMIDNSATTAKIAKFLLNTDRVLLNYVYFGLTKGNENAKEGLYKNKSDMYYFSDTAIGFGEDNVLAFLKKDDETAAVVYAYLKEQYEESLLADNKK